MWRVPVVFQPKRGLNFNHLLAIALHINSFAGFQEFIVHNTALVPPRTEHGFLVEMIWH